MSWLSAPYYPYCISIYIIHVAYHIFCIELKNLKLIMLEFTGNVILKKKLSYVLIVSTT